MKKIIAVFMFCSLCGNCFSQAGEWVWIKGDSSPNQPGNFGVQGVPGIFNTPPSFYEACEWRDLNGNFWLFGGSGDIGRYGDLWKYDPVSNMWTWMKGSGLPNDAGNYGTQGVPSPGNNPPSRSHGMATWVDNTGDLWMFGGLVTAGLFSDLWKYEISSNQWTWMKGPNTAGQPGIYGTLGVPDPANYPASRRETSVGWTDNQGDLWLFGGLIPGGVINDLWRFNIASNQWTWMKGLSTPGQAGTYGTQGVESATNTPGSRMPYSRWKDPGGNLWLFGGGNYGTTTFFNDLWRFNPVTNNWAWMGGTDTSGNYGSYGAKCDTSMTNLPGCRFENRASMVDENGNFWMFGGARDGSISIVLNDLWMYCLGTKQWIWISGDSTISPIGNWGIQGVSSPSNKPSGRGGALGWADHNGHLYFFGGAEPNVGSEYNDLWKYTIDTSCGACPVITGIGENNLTQELLVFPNPATSSFIISFSSAGRQPVELRIYNTLGKRVYFWEEESAAGKFEKEINVEKWSSGIYFLFVRTPEQVKTGDLILSRKIVLSR
jgi:hypothetical protein